MGWPSWFPKSAFRRLPGLSTAHPSPTRCERMEKARSAKVPMGRSSTGLGSPWWTLPNCWFVPALRGRWSSINPNWTVFAIYMSASPSRLVSRDNGADVPPNMVGSRFFDPSWNGDFTTMSARQC